MSNDGEHSLIGWNLLYEMYVQHLSSSVKVAIVWTHFNLMRRGFKCAGIGLDPNSVPTTTDLRESLPDGWQNEDPCHLRYFRDKKLYLLTIYSTEDVIIIINLVCPIDGRSSVTVVRSNQVAAFTGQLADIMPGWREDMKRMQNELIDPMLRTEVLRDTQVQTEPEPGPSAPVPPPVHHSVSPYYGNNPDLSSVFLPGGGSIGSADLDPLGRGTGSGSGMIFEPPGMGPRAPFIDPQLPRGAVPPGARFDPIMPGSSGIPDGPRGPLGPLGPRGPLQPRTPRNPQAGFPDPDHLPPPGYDDMFS